MTSKSKFNIKDLVEFDERYDAFRTAIRFINYELIPGDIFEFGVYTGRSMALLSNAYQQSLESIHTIPFSRRIVGFDSFEGLPETDHPRWQKGDFSVNHSYNPFLSKGADVTPDVVYELFDGYGLPKPKIHDGLFSETLPQEVGDTYTKAALLHIDCDLTDCTLEVLELMEPTFQPGTVLLFDDWFNFKGDPTKGEAAAFSLFLKKNPKWIAIEYFSYVTFAKAFILQTPDANG